MDVLHNLPTKKLKVCYMFFFLIFYFFVVFKFEWQTQNTPLFSPSLKPNFAKKTFGSNATNQRHRWLPPEIGLCVLLPLCNGLTNGFAWSVAGFQFYAKDGWLIY